MSDTDPPAGADGERERSVPKTEIVGPAFLSGASAAGPPGAAEPARETPPPSEILARLARTKGGEPRYRIGDEIAHGGMGSILQVWDDSLDRSLAMKVIRGADSASTQGASSPVEGALLARFLEEAQVTGQLDHPGVVPVHELGLDAGGRVYFTMKLVKGRDLKAIFDLVFEGRDGWNETRALGVLLKVCEAMAYAHAKGVIHRDLKPSNVMVGNFGEVYVMDWGLARALGRKDTHDLRFRPEEEALSSLKTERRREREEAPDSPLVTMDGIVVGTPAYMPPEQARGDIESLGPRSDVYSIGAMLYHLLARETPYVPRGARVSSRTLLASVLAGPPAPLSSIRRDVPAELVAIVEKAMAREISRRYATTLALADDLRAFLENRVVRAYETGPVAELRKWVVRNRSFAATIGASVLALVAALFVANAAKTDARRERDQVLRLSDVQRLKDLETDEKRLWPAYPEKLGELESWLERARSLARNLDSHRTRLDDLRAGALPSDGDPAERRTYRFTSAEEEWQHGLMAGLVEGIESLTRGDGNDGWSALTIRALERRLEFARTIGRRSIDDEKAAWDAAVAGIRASGKYGGSNLAPQMGLVPIGSDPESGLFEFWHVQSGERPIRGEDDGRIVPHEAMGIVFVFVPGGTFAMGSRASEVGRLASEGPRHDVTIDAFFISKYEMTQGQWQRFTGTNPSAYKSGRVGDDEIGRLSPVEQVSWTDCEEVLGRLGLVLPTEAQWEYAARAGTDSPWWTGDDRETLRGHVNIADQAAARAGAPWQDIEDFPGFDDGHAVHAPVGSLPANPFGLHEVLGNVWEWCRDWWGPYGRPVSAGDGERQVEPSEREFRVSRGGSFALSASRARAAFRDYGTPQNRGSGLGVRPARRVEGR